MAHLPTTFEKRWPTVILMPIVVANHVVTVSSTAGLHTKQRIVLAKTGLEQLELEIKRVISDTQLHVGVIGQDIALYSNPVAYNGGTLTSSEQKRNEFGSDIVIRAVYEEEPAVALRNVLVNRWGEFYSTDNPLPVDVSGGTISIGGEAKTPHIANLPMPASNTEYSYSFALSTKKITIASRKSAKLQVAFIAGNTNTTYYTMTPGTSETFENLDTTAVTLYVRSSKDADVLEVLYWD